jgi:hypothetical protein
VLVFLVVAVGVLGWIRFHVIPQRLAPARHEFDLVNPLVSVEVGDCVEAESLSRPGDVTCLRAVEPGVVRRPYLGPDVIRPDRGLKRASPYLVAEVRVPGRGQTCATAPASPELWRCDLNDFGMASHMEVELASIRPRWISTGDRHHFAYEVVLQHHGSGSPTWVVYVAPWVPVLGTILKVETDARGQTNQTTFRESTDCEGR